MKIVRSLQIRELAWAFIKKMELREGVQRLWVKEEERYI